MDWIGRMNGENSATEVTSPQLAIPTPPPAGPGNFGGKTLETHPNNRVFRRLTTDVPLPQSLSNPTRQRARVFRIFDHFYDLASLPCLSSTSCWVSTHWVQPILWLVVSQVLRPTSTEVCPKSPFRAKEFLPSGVHYNPNPRELFRAPDRLNLGVGASLSHRYV
jgi:hypothetical protein